MYYFSKKYIKMCACAEEIQKYRTLRETENNYGRKYLIGYKPGDHYATITKTLNRKSQKTITRTQCGIYKNHLDYASGERCWMPRQDELQLILVNERYDEEKDEFIKTEEPYDVMWGYIYYLSKLADKELGEYWGTFEPDEMWLAYVMLKKFNKKWNGESWENANAQSA